MIFPFLHGFSGYDTRHRVDLDRHLDVYVEERLMI
jgi:hypothetical protein